MQPTGEGFIYIVAVIIGLIAAKFLYSRFPRRKRLRQSFRDWHKRVQQGVRCSEFNEQTDEEPAEEIVLAEPEEADEHAE